MSKPFLFVIGLISLSLGIIGIFIPGLPTTPFLLLASSLFLRSSDKLYKWLIRSKYLGPFITDFQRDKGMTLFLKIFSIIFMWIMILISVFFIFNSTILKLLITGIGIIGTIVMGFIIPTVKDK